MKKLKKVLFSAMMMVLSFNTAVPVFANTAVVENTYEVSDILIQPRVDSTGYFYDTLDGYLYKRLWSYTRAVWVDPWWYPAEWTSPYGP